MLPLEAVGDENGRTTYPERLVCKSGARLLHIKAPEGFLRALCGVSCDTTIECLDGRPRPVCADCRKKAKETTR